MKAANWKAPERAPVRKSMTDSLGRVRGGCWRGRLAVPAHAHPLVRRLFEIINDEEALLDEVAAPAGLSVVTIKEWRRKNPTIVTFDAAARVLGYRLALVPDRSAS
ncbi:hypothetical protein [Roseomonas xinghualingensis]|uniref:hypothetical protein n=1 Tax=Roseomonas xinghualingensis TaxID=2986475 RepID=UPI0021F1E367|nr:hypothetical protein [Roseomonas sp. SXEYE001]MCV4210281.1 hypothetical protein [Roseomonas sp. SXEYE001]